MKAKIIFLIFLTCGLASAGPYCQDTSSTDLLLTGTTTFINSYQGPRQHCYDLPLHPLTRNPLSQAIAVPSSLDGYSTTTGLDYSVQIGQSDKGLSLVLMIANDYSWKRI